MSLSREELTIYGFEIYDYILDSLIQMNPDNFECVKPQFDVGHFKTKDCIIFEQFFDFDSIVRFYIRTPYGTFSSYKCKYDSNIKLCEDVGDLYKTKIIHTNHQQHYLIRGWKDDYRINDQFVIKNELYKKDSNEWQSKITEEMYTDLYIQYEQHKQFGLIKKCF